MPAPLAVIAFNRPDKLTSTLDSLSRCDLAQGTDIFIYVDGPRTGREGEPSKVAKTIEVARSATGFKSVSVIASPENRGLAASVTGAAGALLDRFGRVIVLEDDLAVAPGFLLFMNTMLDRYENDSRVMQISAFGTSVVHHRTYPWDVYLNRRAHSWSWATWKDRWDTVDWQVSDFEDLARNRRARRSFNEYGSDLFGMLEGWKTGRNNSWYIRFNYSMHKQGRFCVCPVRTLVRNEGFGSDATNCRSYNRYKTDESGWNSRSWSCPERLEWDKGLNKEAVRYWNIPNRIKGKIITAFYRIWT